MHEHETEERTKLSKHNTKEIKQIYSNVVMLNATPVDLGIVFGLVEFEEKEMIAKYHTMVRLSFEQALKLSDGLNDLLQSISLKEENK